MNYITGSFSPAVSKSTVKMPVDQSGVPLVVDEDQIKTFRSFFETYNAMSDACFRACVWDFGTESMRAREARCVTRCAEHYLQTTKEIGKCFAEGQEGKLQVPQ